MKRAHYLYPDVTQAARTYARSFGGLERILVTYRPAICPFEWILEAVPARSSVLDIGCGSGFLLYALATLRGIRAGTGIEMDDRRAVRNGSLLRNRLEQHGLTSGDFVIAGAAVFGDWPPGPYDVVIMVDVLHHVSPSAQEEFVAAALRRVAENGIFVYKDMCERPAWRAAGNRLHDLVLARQWIHYVSLDRVRRLLLASGFEEVATNQQGILWYGHELLVARRVSIVST